MSAIIFHPDEILGKLGVERVDPYSCNRKIIDLNKTASVYDSYNLTDYGRVKKISHSFWLFSPGSIDKAVEGLNRAALIGLDIRVRGAGHSMNGSSLPGLNELLFSSLNLNWLKGFDENTIDVGCGAQIWEVDQLLRHYGCSLPVIHDGGGPASTVGGFFCAGGFGINSKTAGGFWNHVKSLKIWTPTRGVKILSSNDDEFWHLAASGGRKNLVILSLNLSIVGRLDLSLDRQVSFAEFNHPRLLWFTFISPIQNSSQLYREISTLHNRMKVYWDSLPPYSYLIKTSAIHRASCFYPNTNTDLVAAGVWGNTEQINEPNYHGMISEIAITASVLPSARRYWQSEL